MKHYTFHVYLNGYGDNPEEGWRDAVEGFQNEEDMEYNGETYSQEEIEDEENEN